MAQYTAESEKTKWLVKDQAGNPLFGVLEVGEGTTSSACVLVLEVQNTSYYLWIDATGDLRAGTTLPTAGALTGTGTVVGSQS